MPLYTAQTSGTIARNGTAAASIPTPNGASTPAGAFLMVVVAGAIYTSTVASGWTSRLAAHNSGGVDVFTKDSATAGEASLAVTFNGSNYPAVYESFQFPSGTAYVTGTTANAATATGAWTALTGLTSVEFYYAAVGNCIGGSTGTGATTWTGATETTDILAPKSGTDGGYISSAYAENLGVTSWTPSSSSAIGSPAVASTDWQRVWLGLDVPGGAVSVVAPKLNRNRQAIRRAANW